MSLDGRLIGTDDEDYKSFYAGLLEQMLSHLKSDEASKFKLASSKAIDYCEQIGSYSAAQLLRNYAAYLAVHGKPPERSNTEFIIGPELEKMYEGLIPFEPFNHLIDHSDSEGYYLPIDFEKPLNFEVKQTGTARAWMCDVGSSQALLRELDELNKHFNMPGDYGQLGGYDELSAVISEGDFGAERWVWGVMHWLARESVEKQLLFEFC